MAGNNCLSTRDARLRVLIEGVCQAERNMQLDAGLLKAFQQGNIPPTLRLYQWDQPAISYGYGQTLPQQLIHTCKVLDIPLVKRPTGGKAVLHGHDLTLALVFLPAYPAGEVSKPALLRSPRVAYEQIAPLFIEVFRRLEVPAAVGHASPPDPTRTDDGGDCFATPAITDIIHTETGVKLVGCALRSQEGGTLMQASIPIQSPGVPAERFFGHPHPDPPFQDLQRLTKVICEVFQSSLLLSISI